MRPLEISIKNCRAIAAEQACGSPLTARECHKQKNMKNRNDSQNQNLYRM